MAAEWRETRNLCLGYNFQDIPDPADETGFVLGYRQLFSTNLAVRLLAAFGKAPPPTLMAQASQSYSAASTANATVRETQYPERQPVGSGNTLRLNRWRRFYQKYPLPPINCETQNITQEQIEDYQLNLSDYLDDGEAVSTYTYETSSKISVVSESLSAEIWSYRAEAAEDANRLERIQLKVETDAGREQTFTINFDVTPLPKIT
jgi:hypothetical protein